MKDKLTINTKPMKEFTIGRWFFAYKIANDIWAKDIGQTRETYYLKLNKLEHDDGTTGYNLTLWKLSLWWSKLD